MLDPSSETASVPGQPSVRDDHQSGSKLFLRKGFPKVGRRCDDARVPTQEFAHAFTVAAPPAAIYDHLSRPQNWVGLSPLVVEVRDVRTERCGVRYTAVESFRFGPFRWDNLIRVAMTFPEPDRCLVSDVHSPGRVHLVATTGLAVTAAGTAVTETIRVTYPWLLGRFVIAQATSVQKQRAAELTRRLEQAPTTAG
jgi:hypothetical protein